MIEQLFRSKAVQRLGFVAITLTPVIIIFATIVIPIRDHFTAQKAEIVLHEDRLARLKGIAAYRNDSSLSPEMAADGVGEYITGPNEGVASANLQTRLKGMIQGSGAQLHSVQGLPPETDGPLRIIGARLNLAGRIETVHNAIFMIENARPYVFITGATLKMPRQIRRQSGQQSEPIIEAQLDVFGAFKRSGPSQ